MPEKETSEERIARQKRLGYLARELRTGVGLTPGELAQRMQIDPKLWGRYEAGKLGLPMMEHLRPRFLRAIKEAARRRKD